MSVCRAGAILALLAALAAAPQGCGKSADVPELTLQTLAEPGSAEYKLLDAVLAEFGRRHPELKLRLAGSRLKLEYLMRSVVARDAADVVEVRADEVSFLLQRGALVELTADCMALATDCEPGAWENAVAGNRLYAVPWAANPKLLLYNKAAFREAGLPDDAPPKTWDELLEAARRLTRDTNGDGKPDVYGFALAAKRSVDLGKHFATFLAQLGLPLLSLNKDRWTFNFDGSEGRKAMKLLIELQKHSPPECVVTGDVEALRQFHSGIAAMVISGPAGLSCAVSEIDPDEIGVADLPAPAGGSRRCDVEFRYMSVPAFVRGQRRAAAVELVKFIASAQAQKTVARGVDGCTPVISIRRRPLDGAWYQPSAIRMFAGALAQAAPVYPALVWEGKCWKSWIGGIHSLLIGDSRGIDNVLRVSQEKGQQALACLFTDIGHPSWTIRLGMILVALVVFAAVTYAVSRH